MNIHDYTQIDHLIPSIKRYTENRLATGGFLRAVLENNLKEAVNRADSINVTLLPVIVAYLYNEVPGGLWGSPDRVDKWLAGPEIPTIFETDADGEATGTIHLFCTHECREKSPLPLTEQTVFGSSLMLDLCDESVCETCGKVINE